MKKLLILAYDFPPYVSVGGLRPYNWYKYLKEFGVEPIVVTRQWGNKYGNHLDYIAPSESDQVVIESSDHGTIIRAPYKPNLSNRLLLKYGDHKYKIVRKVITGFYEVTQYFFNVGPKSSVFKAAQDYLRNNRVDAIIATGDPFVLFKYARELSKEFGVPWVADYRDPWSKNTENNRRKWETALYKHLEKKFTTTAKAITTVSMFVYRGIEELCPNVPYYIIPNGYDPEAVQAVNHIEQNAEVFTIAFVGTIYNWHPYRTFLIALSEWLTSGNYKFKLQFFGTNIQDELQQFCTEELPSLNQYVEITWKMPNAELLAKLKEANVLLLFNYYSYMGTKIYDYIAMNRKILLCYTDDPEARALKEKYYTIEENEKDSNQLQWDLLKQTNSGIAVKDSAHLKESLTLLYEEFKKEGKVVSTTKMADHFSRKSQTGDLASIVKNL